MLLKKLVTFILAMQLLSGCQHTTTMNTGKSKEINKADVVNIHGSIKHLDRMDLFLNQVQQNQNASIRVTHYTDEGDPIYHNMKHQNGKFAVQYDTTQDHFGEGKVTTYLCDQLEKRETDTALTYTLHGCSGSVREMDVLNLSYDLSKQDYFGFHLKYGERLTNEINTIDMSLIKDLGNGLMQGVMDFQLNKDELQQIYKKMVLSAYFGEKNLAICAQQPEYDLKVKINDVRRSIHWSACDSEDNKALTQLANEIIEVVKLNSIYTSM